MISIEKTTAAERQLIADIVWPIMCEVETALNLLWDIQSEYFEMREQPPLKDYQAGRVGTVLNTTTNQLFDACAAFSAVSGIDDFVGGRRFAEQEKLKAAAREVDQLHDDLEKRLKQLDGGRREVLEKTRGDILKMSDEQALVVLRALIESL